MSHKARVLIGVISTLFFGVMGVSFALSGKPIWGVGLLALATLRASVVFRQYQALSDDDDDNDD